MTSHPWTRRRFVLAAGAASASAAVGLYTWRIEPHWLEIVRRPLPVEGLPSSLIGRTLVQISDVHVGLRVDDDYVLDTFRRVIELGPDIVVFTGDFVSYHPAVFQQARAIYRSMPRGRLATIGILGNHDYGPAWAHPELAQQLVDTLVPLGIHILRNDIADINGLQVVGLDDWWAHRFAPAAVLPRVNPRGASLVLSHNPDTADIPGWGDYRGWILAGHTHGGQCKPPFLPPPLLPVRNRRYTAGEFTLSGARRMYISRGVGHLLHVRFNVRPEVTVFELSKT
jgi:predicted MPP superfamily phosphohydrolase